MRWQLDVHGVSVRLAGCGSIEEVERSSHSRGKRSSSASSNLCYSDRTLFMCTWCRMLTAVICRTESGLLDCQCSMCLGVTFQVVAYACLRSFWCAPSPILAHCGLYLTNEVILHCFEVRCMLVPPQTCMCHNLKCDRQTHVELSTLKSTFRFQILMLGRN